jgi:hypothetical protein
MITDLVEALTEFAQRSRPPLELVGSSKTGSFDDAIVELRDRKVLWRVLRERSVLGLMACPEFDRSQWYDADLLRRFFGGGSAAPRHKRGSAEAFLALMKRSVEDVINELEEVREPVAAAFTESTWEETRQELIDLGRRRDLELFGRPSPNQ